MPLPKPDASGPEPHTVTTKDGKPWCSACNAFVKQYTVTLEEGDGGIKGRKTQEVGLWAVSAQEAAVWFFEDSKHQSVVVTRD